MFPRAVFSFPSLTLSLLNLVKLRVMEKCETVPLRHEPRRAASVSIVDTAQLQSWGPISSELSKVFV